MKKYTSIIRLSIATVTAFIALSMTSCGIAAETIEDSVKEANKSCPMRVDEYTMCERIYTSGNDVIYDYRTSDEVIYALHEFGLDECKNYHYLQLATAKAMNGDVEKLIELCIEAEYNIVYDYNNGHGNSYPVKISHKDMKKM